MKHDIIQEKIWPLESNGGWFDRGGDGGTENSVMPFGRRPVGRPCGCVGGGGEEEEEEKEDEKVGEILEVHLGTHLGAWVSKWVRLWVLNYATSYAYV